ncbi:MAG: hypothetical protein QF681_16635 [Vicinamibacterales bacterium]|jgi:hypothetical protein|nr:hypothetical protein [Vicinamibacterales bacterium]
MLARVRCGAGLAVVAAVTVLISGGTVVAQQDAVPPASPSASASEALARQLAEALGAAQLDSIAAKDSQGADRFVAALYFPGRLLVVSARYEAPMYVEEKIAEKNYREVYLDLNAASIAESKVLITDGGANGLRPDDMTDSANTAGRLVRFGGDWSGQELSRDAYTALFAETDAGYMRMLRALLAQVN